MRIAVALVMVILAAALVAGGQTDPEPSPDEQTLRAAGLNADAAALLEFFHQRSQPDSDGDKMLALARKLGDPDPGVRAKATGLLVSAGPGAIPALRHVVNDLEDPVAAEQAQRCLEWLEGRRRGEVPLAATRLLAAKKPAGAALALLRYLPFADDAAVIEDVKIALRSLANSAGKPEPALLKALQDPLPLRRAVAIEVLGGAGLPELLPDLHKLLADPNAQVRLKAALAFSQRHDEKAFEVLIDLLADLPASQSRLAEDPLRQLAGELSPKDVPATTRQMRRDAWAAWWQKTDGAALLNEFRKRTLGPEELAKVLTLIDKLGDKAFSARERAAADLVALGPKVIPLLREAAKSPDLERAQRAQDCLKHIARAENKQKLPNAAARLLALRKPEGATAALLAFVPFTDDEQMKLEVGHALKQLAVSAGKPDPILVKTLEDSLPLRRVLAAETLAGARAVEHFGAVHKLLRDPDPQVRLRVALALTYAHDKEAVPVLIELVAEQPKGQTWEAEELLNRLAGAKAPKTAAEDSEAARKRFREEWTAWWKTHAATVNLAQLDDAPATLGYTLVAEVGDAAMGKGANPQPGGKRADRVVELDRNGKPRWEISDLVDPVDAHVLPGNHVLIAEYAGQRVTERDLKGTIVWQYSTVPGQALNAQRLPNGNTFIAIFPGPLMEVDRNGKTVFSVPGPGNVRSAFKMPNGQMVCLGNGQQCIRLDATGKEIKRFPVKNNSYAGAIEVTSKGHVLVPQTDNTVTEYDLDGNIVWKTAATMSASATRLPNGHTLIAYANAGSVVELDGGGRVVWEYKAPPGHRPFRARQR